MHRSSKPCSASLHWQRSSGHDYRSLPRWVSFDARSFQRSFCHHC
ncbi:hypothetical protein LINGRAPRIM_LOCUS735 [Linum grandiflorum]